MTTRSLPSLRRVPIARASTAIALVAALIVVFVVGAAVEPGRFVTETNFSNFGISLAIEMIVAIGAAAALLGGVVDFSIGSMVGTGAAIFVVLDTGGIPPIGAAGLAILASIAVGSFNASVCVVFGAPALLATLGSLTALQGVTFILLHDESKADFLPGLYQFTNATWHGIPELFGIAALAGVACTAWLSYTRYGRHVRAVGGDEQAARRAGIPVSHIRFALFVLTALCAGIAGILYVGQTGSAQSGLGTGLELQVYAPVLLGGYSLTRGGIGNVLGALLGLILLSLVGNVLDLDNASFFWQQVVTGVVLIAAVYVDGRRRGETFR